MTDASTTSGRATAGLPPRTKLVWFRVGSIALISFTAFEALAVSSVLPRAAAEFGATAQYSVAFGAAFAAMIVGVAWAGPWVDRSGVRAPLIFGVLLFGAGLLIVGFAQDMNTLALGRGLKGMGSGVINVVIYAMAGRLVPAVDRPRIFAAYSAAWVVPALVGPAIAGLAADTVGWRWVFLGLVVPALLAGLAAVQATRGLDETAYRGTAPPNRRLLGAALVTGLAMAVAQFAGPRGDSGYLLLALAALAVSVVALHAMLPAGTFTARAGIPRVVLIALLVGGAFFGAEIYVPLYLTEVDGLSPFAAGSVLTGSAIAWAAAAQLQARVPASGRARERLPLVGASLVAASITAVAIGFAVTAPWPVLFAAWAVGGIGMGLNSPTMSVLILAASAPAEQGANAGALKLADVAGTALAMAVSGALFAQVLIFGSSGFAATLLVPLAAGVAAVAVAYRLQCRSSTAA